MFKAFAEGFGSADWTAVGARLLVLAVRQRQLAGCSSKVKWC